MKHSTTTEEAAVLAHARDLLATGAEADWRAHYAELTQAYARMCTVSQRLLSVSDMIEARLKKAHDTITRQSRELEARIREFEAIFSNTALGIGLAGTDGALQRVNARLCELLGFDAEDLVGLRMDALGLLAQDAAGEPVEIPASLSADSPLHNLEARRVTSSGRQIWLHLCGRLMDSPGLPPGTIWTLADITDRKELEATREDVERIMRHDLKSPLNAILNLPMLIESEGAINAPQRELLGHIAKAGQNMLRQINLSLDLYKIETGTYRFDPAPVRLDKLAAETAEDLKSYAAGFGTRISLDCLEVPPAGGEEQLCACLMTNLLKNAVEACPAGGQVTVTLRTELDALRLVISNPGAVPGDMRNRFFDKYATSGKAYGTGLGTYSARLMARAMGGEVELDVLVPGTVSLVVRLRRY